MAPLRDYLLSLDGGRKEEGVAKAISRDVNKFLFFCHPRRLRWEYLTSRDCIHRFAITHVALASSTHG